MRSLLLGLSLALFLTTAAGAEEIVTPLGDRWYRVQNPEPTVIPESGVIGPVIICLDEVPGGLDSTPSFNIKPLVKETGGKRTVTLTREGFFPLSFIQRDGTEMMAYASYVLRGIPGTAFSVSVIIRGKE